MITRIHGATSTLAANPAKKHRKVKKAGARKAHKKHAAPARKRKPASTMARAAHPHHARKRKAHKRRPSEAARKLFAVYRRPSKTKKGSRVLGYRLAKNPEQMELSLAGGSSKKRRTRKAPVFSIYARGKGAKRKYQLRKNPAIGGVVFAGVPVIDMAIGSAATIAIGAISKKLITKFAPAVATSPVGDIAGELATAGVSALLYMKVLKNPMHKSIAQFAFIGAVFQILSKKLSPQIEDLVGKIPGLGGHYGSTHGIYFDPYTSTPAVGGAYLPTTAGTDIGGMYTNVDGLGLFNAPSIYG